MCNRAVGLGVLACQVPRHGVDMLMLRRHTERHFLVQADGRIYIDSLTAGSAGVSCLLPGTLSQVAG